MEEEKRTISEAKERKLKEKRKKRKEMQKLKKKLNPNNINSSKMITPITFSAESLASNPKEYIDAVDNDRTTETNKLILSCIKPSNSYYARIIQEMTLIPESSSTRHKIMDFFNRIYTEYESFSNQKSDDTEREEWLHRAKQIKDSLSILSYNMKAKHRTIPESIMQKLLLIRESLLQGNVYQAESHYLDMDVGNMVVNNSDFFYLTIPVTTLFTCLTNIKRLINFFTSTMIQSSVVSFIKQTKIR